MCQNYTDDRVSPLQHTVLQESSFLGYRPHLLHQYLEEEKILDRF